MVEMVKISKNRNLLQKKEIEELYKDAIYNHLLRDGYSEYKAEGRARVILKQLLSH